MSEESKAVVRKFYTLFDQGDMDGLNHLLSPGMVWRFAGIPMPFDKQSLVGFLQPFRTAFPDMRHSLDSQIVEGERVVTPLTFRATNRGELQVSRQVEGELRSGPQHSPDRWCADRRSGDRG